MKSTINQFYITYKSTIFHRKLWVSSALSIPPETQRSNLADLRRARLAGSGAFGQASELEHFWSPDVWFIPG